MDPRKLIRSPAKVLACLQELPDGRMVCTKDVKIYIPARWRERNLASLGVETAIVGIFAMVVDDLYYGVSNVNAMMRIQPTVRNKVLVDEEEYFEFFFRAGSTVVTNVNLPKVNTLTYRIFDEILSKAKVPWYLSYLDIVRIFETADYHAGAKIGAQLERTHLIASIIARDSKDRTQYYRQTVDSLDKLVKNPPAWVPLRSVPYGATNTTAKLGGSYFGEGVTSALIDPSDRVERLEKLLTS